MIGDAVSVIILNLADFRHMNETVESDGIMIDEATCFLIEQSIPTTRTMQRKKRDGMVIIDYLQLISVPAEKRRSANLEREVAKINRAANLLAKERNIPIFLLA